MHNVMVITHLTLYQTMKFWTYPNWKHFAHNKISVTEKLKYDMGRVENIVGRRENEGYQDFVLFPKCFQKLCFSRSLKVRIVW